MAKAEMLRFLGIFQNRDEAAKVLKSPGDSSLVERGVPRLLLICCPCRCGDTLIINLDARSGPAWRMYRRGSKITLFPSYWRDSGCKSHFILWNNRIHWCNWDDEWLWTESSVLEEKVLRELTEEYRDYTELAELLGEIPWDVLKACRSLVRKGYAAMRFSESRGEFRRLKG